MVSTPVRKREVEDLDTRDQLLCLTVIGKDLLSLTINIIWTLCFDKRILPQGAGRNLNRS